MPLIDPELLEILVCPENHTGLTVADEGLVNRINDAIRAGTLNNRKGEKIEETIDGGLVREDGQFLYIIREEIPVMLIDDSIPLSQVN